MTSAQVCILISIAVYLIAMLAIGIVCSKRNNTVDDFYLGGRRLGPVVTAMSAEASDMSSWLLMGLPGVAYLTGVADPGWTAIGLGVGTYINWLVVARRLRAGLFLSPIRREKTYSYRHGSHFNYCILCAVHSLRLCRLR